MHQQQLQAAATSPVEQDPRAAPGHGAMVKGGEGGGKEGEGGGGKEEEEDADRACGRLGWSARPTTTAGHAPLHLRREPLEEPAGRLPACGRDRLQLRKPVHKKGSGIPRPAVDRRLHLAAAQGPGAGALAAAGTRIAMARPVGSTAVSRSAAVEGGQEPVDQLGLGGQQLLPGRGRVEPAGPVDLGELPPHARAGRPLQGEGVAGDGVRVEVAGAAQALTTLPPRWRTSPSTTRPSAGGRWPVSSSNSRRATASGSSPSPCSPLGIDQAPTSRLAHNGPPGCTSSTSTALAPPPVEQDPRAAPRHRLRPRR